MSPISSVYLQQLYSAEPMPAISILIRRTHMYLALFFFPWMLMYALSTAVMNHRASFAEPGAPPPPFERERQIVYDGVFPENAELRTISRQILASLDLDGAHGVTRRKDGAIVISRNDLVRLAEPMRSSEPPSSPLVALTSTASGVRSTLPARR